LVYRNTDDVIECIESIDKKVNKVKKIVIVNSYYDDIVLSKVNKIAKLYNCEVLNVPNKGYGYGNNRGLEYISENYNFDYVIISNPDIVIKKFDDSLIKQFNTSIIAPTIYTVNHKAQNPYWLIKNPFVEWLIYFGYKRKCKIVVYFGYLCNKLVREFGLICFRIRKKRWMRVYAAHGSFFILPKDVFKKIDLPYDENMFLFAEEAYLAHRLEECNIYTIMTSDIEILHKEDGSLKISNIDETNELRKSIIYYYEKVRNTK
jgi:GT2 family glycosyltransferase